MAAPKGQIIVRMNIDAIEDASRRATSRAAKVVAAELEGYIERQITKKQSPPASKPGQYPHIGPSFEKPKLYANFRVTGTDTGLTVYCSVPHGKILEDKVLLTGTPGGRLWATRAMAARNWMAKVQKLARELTGGDRRRST
jgi:hypothetical protein